MLETDELARLQLDFLLRLVREDGDAFFYYRPHSGPPDHRPRSRAQVPPRLGPRPRRPSCCPAKKWRSWPTRVCRAVAGFDRRQGPKSGCSPRTKRGAEPSPRCAFLLLALCEAGPALRRRTAARGRPGFDLVGPHRPARANRHPPRPRRRRRALPGLLSPPGPARPGRGHPPRSHRAAPREPLEKAFRYYRHRFRNRFHFGQVCWLAQAAAAWARASEAGPSGGAGLRGRRVRPRAPAGGWRTSLRRLQAKGPGYHLGPLPRDPGGRGGCWPRRRGEHDREVAELAAAARAGHRAFSARLTLAAGARRAAAQSARGRSAGCGFSETRDEVRIDFVQHSLERPARAS